MRLNGGYNMDSIEFIEMLSKCLKNYKRGLISLKELDDIIYQLSFEITYNRIKDEQ
jgi:hypothetical protein